MVPLQEKLKFCQIFPHKGQKIMGAGGSLQQFYLQEGSWLECGWYPGLCSLPPSWAPQVLSALSQPHTWMPQTPERLFALPDAPSYLSNPCCPGAPHPPGQGPDTSHSPLRRVKYTRNRL